MSPSDTLNAFALFISLVGLILSAHSMVKWRRLRLDWQKHKARAALLLLRVEEIEASDRLIAHHLDELLRNPHISEAFKTNIGRWLELRRRKVPN